MKNKKQQFSAEPAVGQPQISSTALTLQRFKKEIEKKEAADEAAKVRCRICFKEIAPVPRCFGHGSGSGGVGGGDSGTASEDKARPDDKSPSKTNQLVASVDQSLGRFNTMEPSEALDSEVNEKNFDPDLLADLVAQGILVINNDRESMTLTISLHGDPNSLSEKQREELEKFLDAIVKEFDAFKEQHSLSKECINIIHDENGAIRSLSINLPTLALYNAFIQQLANNLLPTPSPMLQAKAGSVEPRSLAPTPLAMEPKPAAPKVIPRRDTESEEQAKEQFNPSPFLTQMEPW